MFSPQYVQPDSGQGKVWKCRQLQTFRVLSKGYAAEIKSANFGATILDKGRPFFWSRQWHQNKYNPNNITWEYPALTLGSLEDSINVERPFQQSTKRCYSFQLAVADKLITDCATCPAESCGNRTINEIYQDTETLLFYVLYYLSNVKEATLDPGGETGFWNTDYLLSLQDNGTINSFSTGKDWGGLLNQKAGAAYRLAIEAEKIYITAINFQACFQNCEATEPNFNLPDFGVLARESGCKTCG